MSPKSRILTLALLAAAAIAIVIPVSAAEDGAATFKSKCAMCHGADATGKTPMGARLNIRDLTSPEVQKQSDSELNSVITKGRNKMPAFSGKITSEQATGLVAYIRTLAKK